MLCALVGVPVFVDDLLGVALLDDEDELEGEDVGVTVSVCDDEAVPL